MKYTFHYNHPSEHFLDISFEANRINGDTTIVQLPAWRPGRYELGNFAKNIRKFKVYGDGRKIAFRKVCKDTWELETKGISKIRVDYSYYAFEMNAGSTYLDEEQMYVNPVNCALYLPERQEESCEIELKIPNGFEIACGLKFRDNVAVAGSFHQLVDSPWITSATLQHAEFKVDEVLFHLWFQGSLPLDEEKLISDFTKFTEKQFEAFEEFPVEEYHYLFQILDYKHYHGVEHQNSTVISLGPSFDIYNKLYKELLGVSSHELYHTWNIKAIRPKEMMPYDYSRENYSRLGYVAEGVTTYMGDLFLLKGKVLPEEWYLKELNRMLQRHFDNPGRLNLSVADSSFDTWLDGYVQGVPGRKVSIYNEGALLALILDTMIMRATENKKSLHDVMSKLYKRFGKEAIGYSESDYRKVCEEVSGLDLEEYFTRYVYGVDTIEGVLTEALDYLGYEISKEENDDFCQRVLGMKLNANEIIAIADGSPAYMGGFSVKDKIIGVNDTAALENTVEWLEHFDSREMDVLINRQGQLITKRMPQVDLTFFRKHVVSKMESPSRAQREAFNRWSSKK